MKNILLTILLMFGFSVQAKNDESNKINKFLKENKNVLIHVHAGWCPSCKVQKNILGSIEKDNFELLEVDFSSDKAFLKENKSSNNQ